jgi:hypothetical protein
VSGKKHLMGRTDLDVAISNQRGRLIANVVIAYNSILLSMLLERFQTDGQNKPLELLKKISPVAWQHIHFSEQHSSASTWGGRQQFFAGQRLGHSYPNSKHICNRNESEPQLLSQNRFNSRATLVLPIHFFFVL